MNPVQELTQEAGLTATDVAHLHGPDQSPTPLHKKAPPHPLRADSGETAGQRPAGAAPPSAPGPFRAPPAVPRLLLPSASHGREAPLLRRGRAGRGALGTPARGLRWVHTGRYKHTPVNQEQTLKAAPGRETSVLPTHPARAGAYREPHLRQATKHSYSSQPKAPVRSLCTSTGDSRLPHEHCRAEAAVIRVYKDTAWFIYAYLFLQRSNQTAGRELPGNFCTAPVPGS